MCCTDIAAQILGIQAGQFLPFADLIAQIDIPRDQPAEGLKGQRHLDIGGDDAGHRSLAQVGADQDFANHGTGMVLYLSRAAATPRQRKGGRRPGQSSQRGGQRQPARGNHFTTLDMAASMTGRPG